MLTYFVLSMLFSAFDIVIALRSLRVKNACARFTGGTCIMAAVVVLFYALSVEAETEIAYSVCSSVYFASIDVMLTFLYFATRHQTGRLVKNYGKLLESALLIWTVVDIGLILTNPIHGWMVDYVSTEGMQHALAKYSYDLKMAYDNHLILTYTYVVLVVAMLGVKAAKVAINYRRQYILVIVGIMAVVGINCLFLFLPGDSIMKSADWSLFGYSVASFALYWSFVEYSSHGMLTRFKNYMFDHIECGMVMFDNSGSNLLANESARKLLPEKAFGSGIDETRFEEVCGIHFADGAVSTTAFINNRVLRCDLGVMQDKQGRLIARTYTFMDTAADTDILTGFREWNSFIRMQNGHNLDDMYPAVCALFDINGLQKYNDENGREAGDRLIRSLSEHLRGGMPGNAFFVRGREAELIVICPGSDEDDMREFAEEIKSSFNARTEFALAVADGVQVSFEEAIKLTERSLKGKKLLETNTGHSDNLSSLIKALEECDADTEAHVNRTRSMGDLLGRRLKLSDAELSSLSLLCLLHDIGKIGIPLEILNKPGKLTASEWEVIKSHVHKGYQIAKSSGDTAYIADMILHHHERWDGKGYPDGLKGEEIPLLSRFISVVDSFDAMVHSRVYRKAMSTEEAYAELERCAGSQFDPYLVKEFLTMLRETGYAGSEAAAVTRGSAVTGSSGGKVLNRDVHTVAYARYRFDESGNIRDVYEGFEKLTGYSADYIRANGLTQWDLIPASDVEEYRAHAASVSGDRGMAYLEHRLRRMDGGIITVLCYGKWNYDSALKENRCEVIITEIRR